MNLGKLIIFSGLPGSGKSTLASLLAKELSAVYLRIDTVEQALEDICNIKDIEGQGYRLTYRIAQENLKCGNIVIADSVNPIPLCRHEWNAVAEDIGAKFINVELSCSNKADHQKRIETRDASIPGIKQPSWQNVLDRDYREWDMERVCIDTSGTSIKESLNSLLTELHKNDWLRSNHERLQ